MFSLESPHRGDSNEHTQYTIFIKKKKITLHSPKSVFPSGLKNEVETAVVNEPSVFEPLEFYCSYTMICPLVWELINWLKLWNFLLAQADKR